MMLGVYFCIIRPIALARHGLGMGTLLRRRECIMSAFVDCMITNIRITDQKTSIFDYIDVHLLYIEIA